jgi:hypothetical protein
MDRETTTFARSQKEWSICSTKSSSSEPTDEEIADLVQRKPINMRNKLSTKALSDANFNAVKLKRWSDYRTSWNQHIGSKSDHVLSPTQAESETPVPTTVLDLQKRNSVEICNGDQEMLAAIIAADSSSPKNHNSSKRPSLSDEFEMEVLSRRQSQQTKLEGELQNSETLSIQSNENEGQLRMKQLDDEELLLRQEQCRLKQLRENEQLRQEQLRLEQLR